VLAFAASQTMDFSYANFFAIFGDGGLGSTIIEGLLNVNTAVVILTRDYKKCNSR
jgi:ABC-type proline/glycine betaine transport system permease subunit